MAPRVRIDIVSRDKYDKEYAREGREAREWGELSLCCLAFHDRPTQCDGRSSIAQSRIMAKQELLIEFAQDCLACLSYLVWVVCLGLV